MSAPTQYEIISAKIKELQVAILSNHPQLPLQLREIHKNLKEDPAVVTLLREDEIRIIVNGLEKQTSTFIAASMTTKSASKTKALSKMTSDDLGF